MREFSTGREGFDPSTYDSAAYELTVDEIDLEDPWVVVPDEDGDTEVDAHALDGLESGIFQILGTLRDEDDVDVFSLRGFPVKRAEFHLMPGGAGGYGSTHQPARMWVTRRDSGQVRARVEPREAGSRELEKRR